MDCSPVLAISESYFSRTLMETKQFSREQEKLENSLEKIIFSFIIATLISLKTIRLHFRINIMFSHHLKIFPANRSS